MSLEILNNPLLRNITDFSLGNENPGSSGTIFPNQESPPELKQKTSRQIANTYYGGKPVVDGNGFQIYSDDPVFGGNIEEVVVYKSRFSQTIAGIDVVLFASKNGAFLLQRYMEALPNSNELILFLEIDDRYNHNTVMRAVAGARLANKKDMPFADILSFTRKHEVTVTPKSLKSLIEKGIYRNKVDFISWFLGLKDKSIGEIFSFFKQEALEGASTFFTKGIAENIVKLRISENGWNPNPKEGEYDPTFIPEVFYKEIKDFYEHKVSQNPYENLAGQKKINAKIVKSFFESINEAKDDFNSLLSNAETFFPAFIYKRISKSLTFFFNQIDKLEKFIADPLTGMQHIVYRNYQIANAFLCGIYNSLVDIIAGIFSIIGFIFKAVAAMDKVNDRKVEYGEMFLELMEDLLEGILTFDYVEFFKQCISFQLETIVRLVKWVEEKLPQITLEKGACYYGYIIGIIIDIIVETLLTGGTAAVARLAKSVESFILNPLEKITKAITKAENALNRIIEFIGMILREFKKGSKEIFSKLEKILDEVFGFGEEVADHGLSPKQKRAKDKQKRIQEEINKKGKKETFDWAQLTDDLGGKLLTRQEIEKIRQLLKDKGIHLIVEDDIVKIKSLFKPADGFNSADELFSFLREEKIIGGGFDPENLQLILTLNPSELTSFHELMHVKHYEEVGRDAYLKLNKLEKEMYVWEQIYKKGNKWTKDEIQASFDYINEIRVEEFGLDPVILE
ncbi:zincin-like metallopeptidase toxin domain-containing protein [Chryseobacterium viscerum]|uniref:Tox-MPTase4 domain-containing protein n=1 Tax=Chryseobacterium viscerum TaxID=1037377 RepID=A0A5N4BTT9_9FLAO|nr:zincin-like metallopeptidase toxin domain-containing protein [Chryseobacterium viscerum]KAB1231863.1 hypothetical protein F8D52_04295 [Chryseobacterium viscerum]